MNGVIKIVLLLVFFILKLMKVSGNMETLNKGMVIYRSNKIKIKKIIIIIIIIK